MTRPAEEAVVVCPRETSALLAALPEGMRVDRPLCAGGCGHHLLRSATSDHALPALCLECAFERNGGQPLEGVVTPATCEELRQILAARQQRPRH